MDIAQLFGQSDIFNLGAEFTMNDPFGQPTDLRFIIAGPYSKQLRAARNWYQDEVNKRQRPSRLTASGFRADPIPQEDMEQLYTELLARCVLGWHGMEEGGQPLIRTDESALRVLSAAPWLRDQVHKLIEDKQAFAKGSSHGAKIK